MSFGEVTRSEPDDHDYHVISAEETVFVIRPCQILDVRGTAWAGVGQIVSVAGGAREVISIFCGSGQERDEISRERD